MSWAVQTLNDCETNFNSLASTVEPRHNEVPFKTLGKFFCYNGSQSLNIEVLLHTLYCNSNLAWLRNIARYTGDVVISAFTEWEIMSYLTYDKVDICMQM